MVILIKMCKNIYAIELVTSNATGRKFGAKCEVYRGD